MNREHSVILSKGLSLNKTLRRHFDLSKYLDLLRSRSLYFRRADRFPDKFEGALTPSIRKGINQAYLNGGTCNADAFCQRTREGNFVSCWSLGASDNMALWQLYGGAETSVAVTTTVERLATTCLAWNEANEVEIQRVQYIDHSRNPDMAVGSYSDMLKFKHSAYRFEKEVRIIVPRHRDGWESNPEGLRLPIQDINIFIRSVVVAPEAGSWFFELVKDVTHKYGITCPVKRSKLSQLPT